MGCGDSILVVLLDAEVVGSRGHPEAAALIRDADAVFLLAVHGARATLPRAECAVRPVKSLALAREARVVDLEKPIIV